MIDKIRSKDGTLIACQRSGSGPPLVMVHGILGSSRRWPILPLLEAHFTVHAVDRRGRGDSGDADHYAIERDFEDIAAVVDSIGGEVDVFGHSFGGHCVVEAALLTTHVRRVVAYELGPAPLPSQDLDRLQQLLDSGDREGMVITFLSEFAKMPAHEIDFLKSSPVFPLMLAAAHTVPRELQAESAYRLRPERYQNLTVPTLLLVGQNSPAFAKEAVDSWHAVLPNSRVAVLPGQQHIAHYTAPDLLVREMQAFLQAD
jgi:pimeloyl-ACP methyl ester carboxylesterase